MAINIEVQGTLHPTNAILATHSEEYCRGGYRTVPSSAERRNIPNDHLKTGMMVRQWSDNAIWMWDGANWVTSGIIPLNSVDTDSIVNGAVDNSKLGPEAVTEGKIANDAVTRLKLADGAVINFAEVIIHNSIPAPVLLNTFTLPGGEDTTIQAVFSVKNESAVDIDYKFGKSGMVYDSGISTVSLSGGEIGTVSVVSSTDGEFSWFASNNGQTTVTLLSYMR